MSQLDLFERYPRKKNGKLTCEGLLNYLEDNQVLIKNGKLSMKEITEFSGCHRDTVKKKAVEYGLYYKQEEEGWAVPLGIWNVPFSSSKIKALV